MLNRTNLETQEQRREFIQRLLVVTQKMKSNVLESVGDDATGQYISKQLFPTMFDNDSANIIGMLLKLDSVSEIEDIHIFNLLFLCHKADPVVLGYQMFYASEVPEPMAFMRESAKSKSVKA